MKRRTTSQTSDPDDARRVTQADYDRAEYRVGGKTVTKAEWARSVRERLGKKRISIMLDTAVIEYFKAAAGDRGYQTLINDTLRRAVDGDSLVSQMRLVVREELQSYKPR